MRDCGFRNHGETDSAGVLAVIGGSQHESAINRGRELRQNQIGSFLCFCVPQVLSPQILATSLLPTLLSLKNDRDWRIRQYLLTLIPLLSEQLGIDIMTRELRPITCEWRYRILSMSSYTTDTVAAVRETAAEILKRLYVMYGEEFAENTLLPTLSDLVHNEKYMLRITGLNIIAVGVGGGDDD